MYGSRSAEIDLDGWVAAGIKDLAGVDGYDCHFRVKIWDDLHIQLAQEFIRPYLELLRLAASIFRCA